MEILGHSSISTTLDIYSHVSLSLQREALSALDRAIGSPVTDVPSGMDNVHRIR
jgi:integrase